jgi:molecular chaperone GrpE
MADNQEKSNDLNPEQGKEKSPENENMADGGNVKQAGVDQAGQVEDAVDTAEDLKLQLDSMSDRYLRLMAEFDNFKKRVSRDYERLVESANEKIMIEMVDIRENFDRALISGEKTSDYQSFFDGMKLIFTKFDGVLHKHGLEPFGAVGDIFDPIIHDALMKTPSENIPEDHLADVFEKGYRLKDRVIKHAKVIVSSGKTSANNSKTEDGEK